MTHLQHLLDAADIGAPSHNLPTGAAARQIRRQAGVTATEMAAAVGIAERTLLAFERGTRSRLASNAARLRRARIVDFLTSPEDQR